MKKTLLVRVNRSEFIAWMHGDILCFQRGSGYCNEAPEHYDALAALERGEPVELTDGTGRVISMLVPDVERHELRERKCQ